MNIYIYIYIYIYIMTIDDQIKDEKFQYDINRAALLSGKIDKYEYLAVEEILPSNKKK